MKERFYTKNLASLYARQGYYDDAEKGVRYLLKQEPDRADYLDMLSEIAGMKKAKKKTEVVSLVAEWVTLLKKN